MQELVRTKNMWAAICLVVSLPLLVPLVAILAAVEPYHHCVGCVYFLEPLLTFIITLSVYVLFATRMLYVAWKLKFPDERRIFRELMWICYGVATPNLVTWILFCVDPGNFEFNRVFMWEWISAFFLLPFWWASVGEQMLSVYRYDHRYFFSRSVQHTELETQTNGSLVQMLESDLTSESLKKDFEQFLVRQYAVENLHFVDDVMTFKRFFFEKNDGWRKQKAKLLLETYVQVGSVMEVNISSSQRDEIRKKISSANDSTKNLESVFDVASTDIMRNVLHDFWLQFQKGKNRSPSVKQQQSHQVAARLVDE